MKKNSVELAQEVSGKVAELATRYKSLKQKVADLEAENQRLQEENRQVATDYSDLKARFEIYRLSMAVSTRGKDNTDAKRRIDQLVREIDKCLALLN
ncbi:MAG: cell division protein ZapB [Bacteroidales bacterium]|nr:cell division protein ZapB [Bacteroidales bacterium]